jgi:hypothetical protein
MLVSLSVNGKKYLHEASNDYAKSLKFIISRNITANETQYKALRKYKEI